MPFIQGVLNENEKKHKINMFCGSAYFTYRCKEHLSAHLKIREFGRQSRDPHNALQIRRYPLQLFCGVVQCERNRGCIVIAMRNNNVRD